MRLVPRIAAFMLLFRLAQMPHVHPQSSNVELFAHPTVEQLVKLKALRVVAATQLEDAV